MILLQSSQILESYNTYHSTV